MPTKRFSMIITEEMYAWKGTEKSRGVISVQESLWQILSEYFATEG